MTYQPFLPEAAAGSVEPRHVVVPLRKVLRKCNVITGAVDRITHATQDRARSVRATACRTTSSTTCWSSARARSRGCCRSPAWPSSGIGFKTIGEAIYLRNHVLSRLDLAASITDPQRRRRALTFVFVGGGYAGVEALAELEDMARYALRYVPSIDPDEMRWVLVEAATRIMPEVSVRLSAYTVDRLTERRIDVRLNTMLDSAVDGHIKLSRRRRVRRRDAGVDGRGEGQPDPRRHRSAPR